MYFGLEKEYRQAKLKASANLGSRVLPSNLEVALELDALAEETEGCARTKRLTQMRQEASEIMKPLKACHPVLIGSVWRGTIRSASDIDIEVFSDVPEKVAEVLKNEGFKIQKTEHMTTTEHGEAVTSCHIYGESSSKTPFEVIVRPSEEVGKKRKCDTFGDEIKGLTSRQLELLLKTNPTQQFLPVKHHSKSFSQ